ncbi:lipase 3-like [Culicoides brevitarsis]|uniref:lipase 3-like n=1 Tax=Culicoides brevitarsis TaxID=469753 RepID=UPI00307B7E8C
MDLQTSFKLFIFLLLIALKGTNQNQLMEEKIHQDGYKSEFHTVETPDGYFLQVVRVKNDVALPKDAPVFLLMHGLFQSAGMWVCQNDTRNSLAYQLRDAGIDVWLGNVRGTSLSQRHKTLTIDDAAFWDYSMHEMGTIDIPSMIDYILDVTAQKKLHYVGFSMGGTNFFIMTSSVPTVNEKISSAHLIAPATFLGNIPSSLIRQVAANAPIIHADWELWGVQRLGFTPDLFTSTVNAICGQSKFMQEICKSTIVRVIGAEHGETDIDNLAESRKYYTDLASTQQVLQYFEMINTCKFIPMNYDNNEAKNLQHYGQHPPVEYDLSSISVPITIFYGTTDGLISLKDANILKERVSTIKEQYFMEKWNHLDMFLGKNVRIAIHDKILEDVQK